MAMTRNNKTAAVEALQETLSKAEILLLTRNAGLDAKATNDLRVATRGVGVNYRVAKNTLVKIAIKGTPYETMAEQMTGPIGYVTGTDPVATAKVIAKFVEKNPKLEIVGAKFGDMVMNAAQVVEFSKLPTIDEIRSKLVGLLQAPASQLVGVTDAYGKKENA